MIIMEKVAFSAGNTQILEEISLTIPAGKCTAIVGLSGSGKSILLKIMAGILPPESGQVFYQGKDIHTMSEAENLEFRKNSGFVFQDGALWENKTVYQNLELPLRYHTPGLSVADAEKVIMDELRSLKLEHERLSRPAVLSQGEVKLVSFLRAMILHPQLLFLDEPDTSLDPHNLSMLKARLRQSLKTGSTIVVITNRVDWIADFSDFLLVVKDKKVIGFDTTENIVRNPPQGSREILSSLSGLSGFYSDDILNLVEGESS